MPSGTPTLVALFIARGAVCLAATSSIFAQDVTTAAQAASGQPTQQSPNPWTWEDSHGVTRTRTELSQILEDNIHWRYSNGLDGHRADLHGAHLNKAPLTCADLTGADLSGANLSGADLSFATLTNADLIRAILDRANLHNAHLLGTNLNGASLGYADLNSADLRQTNLTDANLFKADLRGVYYEPTSPPASIAIAQAANIEFLTFKQNPSALIQLRKQFEDNGFRVAERKITYALKRTVTERYGWGERWFNTIAFDWTSQYGMHPGRALLIWLWLFLVCSIIYGVFIHHSGESGIYLVPHGSPKPPEERLSPRPITQGSLWVFPIRVIGREARVAFYALYFSLMTAFSLGVWDINFGRWLHQFPRTEYDLKPKGWVRPVAATQAILSVSLIVLWILTYFGRPFE